MTEGVSGMESAAVVAGAAPRRAGLWRRLLRHRGAALGGLIIAVIVLGAVLAPWLTPYDPNAPDLATQLLPPSPGHPLGTDAFGRDILTRILYGGQQSLTVGLVSVGLSMTAGTLLGLLSGFYGGRTDLVVMRLADVLLAFPSILLAIAIVAILGPGLRNAMIAVTIVRVPVFARLVRAQVLSLREQEFVEAGRALGLPHGRLLFRHVLPNCLAPLIVAGTLSIGDAILEAAGLSFLGLGAQPPDAEWGAMINEAKPYFQTAPWAMTFPGLAIMLAVLGFNLLGDGLRDVLDPRLRR